MNWYASEQLVLERKHDIERDARRIAARQRATSLRRHARGHRH